MRIPLRDRGGSRGRHQARIQGAGAHPWDGASSFKIHYSIAFKHQSVTGRPSLGETLYPPRGTVAKGHHSGCFGARARHRSGDFFALSDLIRLWDKATARLCDHVSVSINRFRSFPLQMSSPLVLSPLLGPVIAHWSPFCPAHSAPRGVVFMTSQRL